MKRTDDPLIFRCFVKIQDQEVEFIPKNNEFIELADKCKLALAEMITGQKCYLVDNDSV